MERNSDNATQKTPTFPKNSFSRTKILETSERGIFSSEYPYDWYELQNYLDGEVFATAA